MKQFRLLFFLLISITTFAQENIDLFIWAGQSNALGRRGNAANYPTDTNNLDNQIRLNWIVPDGSNSNGWTTMGPQDLGHYYSDGHFGAEVTFSRKLVQAGYNPAIFKYTQSATSIYQHWLNPGQGGLYDNMVTALNTAITDLQNQGHTVTVKGFIWIQGESDSSSASAANAYFNNLTMLLNDLRNNVVGNPNLPVLLGVDEQFFNIAGREFHQILNAHQDIALNDNTVKFTSMYGYPKADVTHLTPAGLISQGEDLFDAYQLLVSGQHPVENCTLSSLGNHNSFERRSWGQSFTTECSGMLSNITFEATTAVNSSATFTIHNGADCSGTVLATKSLSSIQIGNNIVDLSDESLYLDKEHTYYFDIVSDNGAVWKIDFSDVDNVFGVLRCTSNDGAEDCGRTFLDYDMDFSVALTTGNSCVLSSSGSEVSFERSSWGQTFSPACSGNITSVTFSAASDLNSNSIFALFDGTDCNAPVLYTKLINNITIGNNSISIDNQIYLNQNNTYYFQITSDNNSLWRIHYSNTDIVPGLLVCTSNDGTNYCGRTFPSFDMNFSVTTGGSDCTNLSNIYAFNYDGRTYEVVKEAKNWEDAAACAVQRGGKLARINDAAEQSAIWNELNNNASIDLTNTVASNGGGASYVWIGGNDLASEGTWIWDGDNDGIGEQFWNGDTNGNPVGGLYSNWGNEPDNSGNQDALAIALTQWPINSGSLGSAGQWNDLKADDSLYFIIEYPTIVSIKDADLNNVQLYPNPVNDILNVSGNSRIHNILLINSLGQTMRNIKVAEETKNFQIDFSEIKSGIYFVRILFENGNFITKKVIK